MKIFLVRHGETDWNVYGRLQGQIDIPLNEKGIVQANELGKIIKKNKEYYKIDIVLSSPLSRAKMSAEIICDEICSTIKLDNNLKEMQILTNEINELEYLYKNRDAFNEFQNKSVDFLNTLKNNYNSILIVGHGTWIKAVYCKVMEIDFFENFSMKIDNCCLIEIEI